MLRAIGLMTFRLVFQGIEKGSPEGLRSREGHCGFAQRARLVK